ncbi:TetR/AcrR family transcriptional regulator [Mycolicibacterium sphagni]|uniref:TetR/AcrR family transcriptional regulator n=1 Tax=Mycolicibacterium sphagni TaxID=1786 RepID=UPI0021F338D1|nr:TetR/AcrR family transcriptional regulator [Mycolicibacterium sphagni]MCV7177083.1 helix-turn-helix transcriptional regulator [Mycolicibacterium sphagni]
MTDQQNRSDKATEKAIQTIIGGTVRALTRRGVEKLSVSDICDASSVSRGTFYRYFASKDDVLSALGAHFEEGIAATITAAIETNPDPAARVEVILDAIMAYRTETADFARMFEATPDFTVGFLRGVFPQLVDIITTALGPAAENSPLVTSGELTPRQLGELFLRTIMSMLLFPGSRAQQVPTLVGSLFRVEGADRTPRRKRRTKAS